MTWKLSMPPATQAPEFREQYEQTPLTQDWTPREARGYDWKVNMDAFTKLEHLVYEKWRLPFIQIQITGPHQGNLWTHSLGWFNADRLGSITIWLHPFQDLNSANETLWHEIQHAYQYIEGRMDTKNYTPFSDSPDRYENHPIEIDAVDFARQMSQVPLIDLALPHVEPEWVPNELHLDAGDWNDRTETWQLSPEKLNHHVEGQVALFRNDYRMWQSTWVGVNESEDFSMWSKRATHVVKADVNGYTNWDTYHTVLMMDNEHEQYLKAREIAKNHRDKPEVGEKALENWAIERVIGPFNAQQIEDAREWNDIPEDERIDHNYEDFKEKHPDSMDLLHGLVGGPDVGDTDPQIIDPSLVNWNEIFHHLSDEISGNEDYEREMQQWQNQGIGWASNHSPEINQMRDAFYRAHGAKPDEELTPEPGQKSIMSHPEAYHNIRVTIPYEHVQAGAGGYHWPHDYIEPATRVKIWDLFGKGYDDDPEIWKTPEAQKILAEDPRAAEIMANGFKNSLSDHTINVIDDIQHGRANPYIPQMEEALRARGYSPEEIAQMMKQRWRWNPETQEHVDLTKDYDAAPPIDKSLDQPGDLTLPPGWSHTII
jgi:hypothetical protein